MKRLFAISCKPQEIKKELRWVEQELIKRNVIRFQYNTNREVKKDDKGYLYMR